MGYYSGNGVIVNGSDTISQLDTVIAGGTLIRERRSARSVLVKNGVSLQTAQGNTPSCSSRCQDLTCGSYTWATPQAAGTIVNYSYSRIGDSNLYSLVEDTENYQLRLSAKNGSGVMDHGNWAALP